MPPTPRLALAVHGKTICGSAYATDTRLPAITRRLLA